MRANTHARVKELREMYLRSYWNSACIDLAFGQSYSYINESLDSLDLSRRGYGIWITGGVGAGKKTFFSGLVKYQKLTDTQTGQQYGINFRYGSNKFRFLLRRCMKKQRINWSMNCRRNSRSLMKDSSLHMEVI
ncbi:MAG: hypothetical protein IPP46_04955 [Bacteroidetes bacterium]|nr:hypothetical protein [Bacteroidota bacterium]